MEQLAYLIWTNDGFRPAEESTSSLLAADSWLVKDGLANESSRHRERFRQACSRIAGVDPDGVDRFWSELANAIPAVGTWFPRAELVLCEGTPVFGVRIRRAPARLAEIRLIEWKRPDPRTQPRMKGPDLDLLGRIRNLAREAGADDAILTTGTGLLLEGLTTSLMWWEGDTLCAPPLDLPILPGVTREIVFELVRKAGVQTACRSRTLAEVLECPIWAVNALHGIRPVVELVGATHPMKFHALTAKWQCAYEVNRTRFAARPPAAAESALPSGSCGGSNVSASD